MMIVYKINIIETLKAKGINTTTVKRNKLLGGSAMAKFEKGETNITLAVLDQLCYVLDMQPGDIIEHIPDKTKEA